MSKSLLPKNVEPAERIARIIGGCAIFYLLFFTGPALLPMQTVIASLSLYPVITGVFGRCALYSFLDISTLDSTLDAEPARAPRTERAPEAVARPAPALRLSAASSPH